MLSPLLVGLGLGLSLIVAIGAQNAFILRQGLRREHVLAIVLVCAVSDAVLIALGIWGLGALIERADWLLTGVRIAGAVFLVWYGARSAIRAARPGILDTDPAGSPVPLRVAVLTALALTWLNPHVYLDTVVLLGSIGATYGENRWWFALGAALGSVTWFTALGFGSRLLRTLFAKPVAWRVLEPESPSSWAPSRGACCSVCDVSSDERMPRHRHGQESGCRRRAVPDPGLPLETASGAYLHHDGQRTYRSCGVERFRTPRCDRGGRRVRIVGESAP